MRRRDVYRGRRTFGRRLPSILMSIIGICLLVVLVVFYSLPRYLVYGKSSVTLNLPILQEENAEATEIPQTTQETTQESSYTGDAVAEIVVVAPDYSEIDFGAGEDLEILQAIYVPFDRVTEDGITAAKSAAEERGVSALVLDMKEEDGLLAWTSSVNLAVIYDVNGEWDMTQTVADLKANGWTLVARISCCVDETMATRNSPLALKSTDGYLYTDGVYEGWLDPWNLTVRQYTEDLTAELMQMGFDEVILDHVEHPDADVLYTRDMSGTLDRASCVSGFAVAVREALADTMEETGGRLSAVMQEGSMTSEQPGNGQMLDIFLKVFDRIYVDSENYTSLVPLVVAEGADSTERLVPILGWTFEGGSWALKYYSED